MAVVSGRPRWPPLRNSWWPGWAFAGALILGAVASAWQRGSIRPAWRPSAAWIVNAAGGMLMGFGAVLAPGGNDALIQHHIPGLSPHALPAFGAMLLGIATVLAIGRMVSGGTAQVDCHGDLCREPSSPDDGAGTVARDRA